jgi:hypothetical protein
MWQIIERKEQEQAGGVTDAFNRKTGRPVSSRPWRHQRMGGSARQVCFQRRFEAV